MLPSAVAARELRKARPDSIIPAEIVKRIEESSDGEAEGIAIAAEQLRELAEIPGISGVTLVTPGDPGSIPATIRQSGLRK